MKKISLVLVAAMLLSAGNLFANKSPKVKPSKELSSQIGNLLKWNEFNLGEADEAFASVLFTLNQDQEIVVISVTTEDDSLETFVKSRLNYQKVNMDSAVKEGKMYRVPVRITS